MLTVGLTSDQSQRVMLVGAQKQPTQMQSQRVVGTLAYARGRDSLILGHLVPCNVNAARQGQSMFHPSLVGRIGRLAGVSTLHGGAQYGVKRKRKRPKHAKICVRGSGSGDAGESSEIGARC